MAKDLMKTIYAEVEEETDMPKKLVEAVYKAYWRTIREFIESLPLKKELTEEEFYALSPHVSISKIGKLYVTYGAYKRTRNFFKRLKTEDNAAHKEN